MTPARHRLDRYDEITPSQYRHVRSHPRAFAWFLRACYFSLGLLVGWVWWG